MFHLFNSMTTDSNSINPICNDIWVQLKTTRIPMFIKDDEGDTCKVPVNQYPFIYSICPFLKY